MFINELIRSDLGVNHNVELTINDETKERIKIRCTELGFKKIIDFETGELRSDMKVSDISSNIEIAIHEKARKISSHFFTPSKKDVKNAIDFLELLGVFSTRDINPLEDLDFDNKRLRKQAGKMVGQLEDLRKNMTLSKSMLKSNAKTTIIAVDKLFSMLPLTTKIALKDTVYNAEKIIKQYFH